MSQALVTGATGFVGSNLVEQLRSRGWDVNCLVRDSNRAQHLGDLGAKLSPGELGDRKSLDQAMKDCDVVYHVAARVHALNESQFQRDNVTGTRNVVEACAACDNIPTLVYVSSLAAGGPSQPGQPKSEADEEHPVSSYGESKLAAERVLQTFAGKVPVSIVRPPIVFGQRDTSSLAIFKGVKNLHLHLVPGWRSFPVSVVHVTDLCDALIRVGEKGERLSPRPDDCSVDASGKYHVAAERTLHYGELGHLAGKSLECAAIALHVPRFMMWIAGGWVELVGQVKGQPGILNLDKVREAVASGWECCDEKIRNELGYRPAATLEERFDETAQWYRQAGWL